MLQRELPLALSGQLPDWRLPASLDVSLGLGKLRDGHGLRHL